MPRVASLAGARLHSRAVILSHRIPSWSSTCGLPALCRTSSRPRTCGSGQVCPSGGTRGQVCPSGGLRGPNGVQVSALRVRSDLSLPSAPPRPTHQCHPEGRSLSCNDLSGFRRPEGSRCVPYSQRGQERDPHLHSPHLRSGQVCMQVQVSASEHSTRAGRAERPQDDVREEGHASASD